MKTFWASTVKRDAWLSGSVSGTVNSGRVVPVPKSVLYTSPYEVTKVYTDPDRCPTSQSRCPGENAMGDPSSPAMGTRSRVPLVVSQTCSTGSPAVGSCPLSGFAPGYVLWNVGT